MGTEPRRGSDDEPREILLRRGEDGWVAEDSTTGVVSQGPTRVDALENLDEAVAGYHGSGHEPTDEESAAVGIDPTANTSEAPTDRDPFDL